MMVMTTMNIRTNDAVGCGGGNEDTDEDKKDEDEQRR